MAHQNKKCSSNNVTILHEFLFCRAYETCYFGRGGFLKIALQDQKVFCQKLFGR